MAFHSPGGPLASTDGMRKGSISRAFTVVVALTVAATSGALAQSQAEVDETKEILDEAKDERAFVLDELQAAVTEYQTADGELEDLSFRVIQLQDRVTTYEASARELRSQADRRAIDAYINGGSDLLDLFFEAETFSEVITSQEVMERAASKDIEMSGRLAATQQEMERLRGALAEEQDRANELRELLDVLVLRLDELYAAADADVQVADATYRNAVRELEAERQRQRLAELARLQGAAAGISSALVPGFICPVAGGASFINDWGFPRSGGRRHKGNDMFAPRGTNLVAVADGSVSLRNSGLGGISVWLRADYGVSFYYAHLDGYASPLSSGDRVLKGQVVGYLGDSGNARGGAPHLHFEIHPGGGAAVNPYPTNVAACG